MNTAIISGSVALIIFAATQLFLHLRSRQELLREKLEDLFSGMNAVSVAFTDAFYAVQDKGQDQLMPAFRKLNEAFYQPRTLILLYFPYITEIWENSVVVQARELSTKASQADNLDSDSCKENVDKASLHIRYLQNFLARNQTLTTEALGFHFDRIFRRRVRIQIPHDIYNELEQDGLIKNGKLGSTIEYLKV